MLNIFGMKISDGGFFLILIFVGIILIWLGFKIFSQSNKKTENNNTENQNKISENPPPIEVMVSQIENTENSVTEQDEEELIAVISAAVAAVLNKPVSGFRVVSFKQRNGWR